MSPKQIEQIARDIRQHKERQCMFSDTFLASDIADACEKLSAPVPSLTPAQLQAISYAHSLKFELWWNSWIGPKVATLENITTKPAKLSK